MQRLILLRYPPGSIKNTWLKNFLKTNNEFCVISQRLICDLYNIQNCNDCAKDIMLYTIERLLLSNKSIVIDDYNYNLNWCHRIFKKVDKLNKKMYDEGWDKFVTIEYKEFDTPIQICTLRNGKSKCPVKQEVLERMFNYIKRKKL